MYKFLSMLCLMTTAIFANEIAVTSEKDNQDFLIQLLAPKYDGLLSDDNEAKLKAQIFQ